MSEQQQKKEWPLAPAGIFKAKVLDHTLAREQVKDENGNLTGEERAKLQIRFRYNDNDGVAQTVMFFGYISQGTIRAGVIFDQLKQLGWDVEKKTTDQYAELGFKDDVNPIGNALIGQEAVITVVHEHYTKNGVTKVTAKVDRIGDAGGGGGSLKGSGEESLQGARVFASLMGRPTPAISMGRTSAPAGVTQQPVKLPF